MASSLAEYWTLTEALAWAVFLDHAVVERFSLPDPESWTAYLNYPSQWDVPEDHEHYELLKTPIAGKPGNDAEQGRGAVFDEMKRTAAMKISAFSKSLAEGRLIAHGRIASTKSQMQQLDPIEWATLTINPPHAYRRSSTNQREWPWVDITILRDEVLALWPDPDMPVPVELKRGRKDWGAVDRKLDKLRSQGFDFTISNRELAQRILGMLKGEYDISTLPTHESLRKRIANYRNNGTLPTTD
jgi:hypothetical protein